MDQLPHVTEEAAATKKSMGEGGPSVEQGTPVQEVLKNDTAAYDNLPKVMKDALNKNQKRGFSTSTARWAGDLEPTQDDALPPTSMGNLTNKLSTISRNVNDIAQGLRDLKLPTREQQDYPGQYHEITEDEALRIARGELPDPLAMREQAQVDEQEETGLKFAPPSVPLEKQKHLQRRYDGVVEQCTNMVMRHGKKSVAQRVSLQP